MKKFLRNFLWVLILLGSQAYAQTRTVTGTVTGKDDGLPLPGVSVVVKGTKTGTQTGPDGRYSIKVAPGQQIVFTFVGFTTQTHTPAGNRLDVVLSGSANELNEVVVIGYGVQSKRANVGSVAKVSGKDVVEQPVQNFEQALSGKASGVQVSMANGVLNTPPVFHIRGVNSIGLGSQPLIVVDGVPVFTGDLSGGESGGNAIGNIDPNDIESIDIAKDASGTAIYGSRAANGVVFITTKKGKAGTAVVSVDSWVGETKVNRLPKVLNASQYIALKTEAESNLLALNGQTATASTPTFGTYTGANGQPVDENWEDVVYRKGVSYNLSASISGGTEKTKYYGSANYSNQEGVIRKNNFDNRGMNFNIDHKANKYITVGAKLSYSDQHNLAATTSGSLNGEAYNVGGLGREAVLLPPNLGAYNADGSYNLNPANGYLGIQGDKNVSISYTNPQVALDLDRANNELQHTSANLYLQVNPLSWITLRSQYGIDYINSVNDIFADPVDNFTVSGGVVTNTASISDNLVQYKRYVWSNTAQFDYTFFTKNNFSLLLGTEQQRGTMNGFGLQRATLSDPAFNVIQAGWVTPYAYNTNSNFLSENYLVSFFGRLNYNFDQKYFLSATIRKDGYSAFGTGRKYGYFPGIGAGWEITREKFWHGIGADKVFSSFKLKASYGKVGNNSGLNDYASYGFYGSGLYNGNPTLTPSQTGNNSLGWETSKKTDIGFDYGILNDRVTGSVAYYKNNITGLILNVAEAPSAGLPTNPPVNVGSMFNRGLEFDFNADVVRTKDFHWTSNFNISWNQNRITSLPGGTPITYSTSSLEIANINRVGGSIGDLYIVRSAGIDPKNGRRIFINGKGQEVEYTFSGTQHWYYMDGTNAPAINQSADALDYGNVNPHYFGGFNNTFRYKNFDLNISMTYQLGYKLYYGTMATLTDQRFWNNSTEILNHWTTPGQVAKYPQVVFGDNVSNGTSFPTDFNTFSGNFLKVKTVNLGYTLPKPFLAKAGIQSVRFYVTGYNLFIWTKYPGPDPEVTSNGTSINGNSTAGVDRNSTAQGRTVTAGVSLKF